MRAGRHSRNAGSFLRKELGEALRIGLCRAKAPPQAALFVWKSHLGPFGASVFLRKAAIIRRLTAPPSGIKVLALCAGYTRILARLGSPLQDSHLPEEEGFCTTSCTLGDTKGIPVTQALYSLPAGQSNPSPSARRAVAPFNTTCRRSRPQPAAPAAPLFYLRRSRHHHLQRQSRCRPLLHNPPPKGGHNPRGEAPSTLTPKACPMASSPSAR